MSSSQHNIEYTIAQSLPVYNHNSAILPGSLEIRWRQRESNVSNVVPANLRSGTDMSCRCGNDFAAGVFNGHCHRQRFNFPPDVCNKYRGKECWRGEWDAGCFEALKNACQSQLSGRLVAYRGIGKDDCRRQCWFAVHAAEMPEIDRKTSSCFV